MGEATSFSSYKTQLVDTPVHIKLSNFGHMISRVEEAYPVSLKRKRLVKIIAFEEKAVFCSFTLSIFLLK